VEYVKELKMFVKTLSAFQNTQFVLAEAQTKVNACRLMIHQAAVTLDQGGNAALMCAEAKWFATETAKSVVDNCLQFFGGYGYIKGFPIEQMYRDVRVFTIFEGATEVQKYTIAKFMGLR
jgi:butyryl-CoA dehydrogenase